MITYHNSNTCCMFPMGAQLWMQIGFEHTSSSCTVCPSDRSCSLNLVSWWRLRCIMTRVDAHWGLQLSSIIVGRMLWRPLNSITECLLMVHCNSTYTVYMHMYTVGEAFFTAAVIHVGLIGKHFDDYLACYRTCFIYMYMCFNFNSVYNASTEIVLYKQVYRTVPIHFHVQIQLLLWQFVVHVLSPIVLCISDRVHKNQPWISK